MLTFICWLAAVRLKFRDKAVRLNTLLRVDLTNLDIVLLGMLLWWLKTGSGLTAHCWGWKKNSLPSLTQTARLVPGLMKARLPKKRNVLWLVSCPSVLWLASSLDGVSVLPHPLPKQQVRQYCHINSDLRILNKRIVQNLCTHGHCKAY